MNIPFLNKPVVKFHSESTLITDEYPIYPAKEYKRKWVKNCAMAFQKYKKVIDGRSSLITAAKCPGLRDVMESGYIVTTWHDFTIETNEKGHEIFYPSLFEEFLKTVNLSHPKITTFDAKSGPMKIPTGDNYDQIFKIFIPYSFEIPKGYELLIMPIQYDDDPKFSACYGKCDGFQSDFNIHIFWHTKNGRVTIPAGTPLCQLVPIKKSSIGIEVKEATPDILKKAKAKLFHKMTRFIL